MYKLSIFLILFCASTIHSQIQFNNSYINNISVDSLKKSNNNFKRSYEINFSSGIFIPIQFYKENIIGTEFNLGLQKNYSELLSLCLDFDLAFAKNIYLQVEFGSKYYFLNNKKFKLFFGPKIGTLLVNEKNRLGFQSFFPLCFSLEVGMQIRLNKKFSVLLKTNNNSRLRVGFDKSTLDNYCLINGGISYQF